jgi:hypothetical protein
MYKFVLVNLYTKISKKKDLHPGWDFNPGPISALEIVGKDLGELYFCSFQFEKHHNHSSRSGILEE